MTDKKPKVVKCGCGRISVLKRDELRICGYCRDEVSKCRCKPHKAIFATKKSRSKHVS